MPTEYVIPDIEASGNERSNVQINVDNGKYMAVVVILAVFCGASTIYAWRASEKADRSEERADLLQYYLLEMDSKLIAAGVKKPEDAVSKKLADKGQ